MIKYQKAIGIISKVSLNLQDEKISILDSLNRVCAKNILSPTKNPLSNNTAFDGFALLSKETRRLSYKNDCCWLSKLEIYSDKSNIVTS